MLRLRLLGKLLSREVATSLRGRAMEVLVHPFSFREALRHAGTEPDVPPDRLDAASRAALDQRLRRYLIEGGFPEAQGATPRDRAALLASYVDVVVLRDVIERHAVSHPLALRWIERQLLANPGGSFSVKKHYDTLRSQGVSVGKDTLHQYLAHLEDAFRRCSCRCAWKREGDDTWERERRALEAAAAQHPGARAVLLTLDAVPPSRPLPQGLSWAPAAHWLLGE